MNNEHEEIISQEQLEKVSKNIEEKVQKLKQQPKESEQVNVGKSQPIQQSVSNIQQTQFSNLTPEMQQQLMRMFVAQQEKTNEDLMSQTQKGIKRKRREIDDQLYRQIREKSENERREVEKLTNPNQNVHKLHSLFNDLQSLSTSLGIPIETPEIVVVGMQSDGKSSFIEALVGFQFNVVESTIGTRRPLYLQMFNNPKQRTPKCCFANENGIFEEREIAVEYLSKEISSRTCDVAGRTSVSNKPLILRIEFSGCSNLTIIDTPGFRLGGDETLKEDIDQMVKELITPSNRIIVCLEQSTTEWANSVSRPLVKEVDPNFNRTVLINTKFDNRVKELTDTQTVANYLNGDELIIGDKKPFFISLPCKRNIPMEQFADYIIDSYISDYRQLLEIGFDETKYHEQLGFPRAKIFLENLLQKKYKEALIPTLNKLNGLVNKSQNEIIEMEKEMTHIDPSLLRKRSVKFIQLFAKTIKDLLNGKCGINPMIYGQTAQEENPNSGSNDNCKLCGGAQVQRVLKTYEKKLDTMKCNEPTEDEIRGAYGMGTSDELAARVIVMNASKIAIEPLMQSAVENVSKVIERFFDICINIIKDSPKDPILPQSNPEDLFKLEMKTNTIDSGVIGLTRFEGFLNVLKQGYSSFIIKLKMECLKKLMDDFEACVNSVELQKDTNTIQEEENLCETINQMKVTTIAQELFQIIKSRMTSIIIGKIKTFLVYPIEEQLLSWLLDGFLELESDQYEKVFNFNEESLRLQLEKLKQQHLICQQNYMKFKSMIKEIEMTQPQSKNAMEVEY
ncbi:dynamin family protein [Entamoeba histolytica HM-1:IMSS-B]|uniref:Dynamin-type G domain-containing protein n=6 Tax=Entamoeba histolytica TaxID=5759 RepID=C4LZL0_ENTH1|nr:hypothetical protein EHI_174650 [Entamoeba histolytica HM-1:IMSS]EMD44404.1 interferoninduced GTP-binding protein Mx2, putative [Entamoeba histolytica KU27]EMH73636.1 dynamin family protein [Entamoeba histolytica HM-1:IMSS-B]ENY63215.1 interferon-induced GTP-binding protein Mx2, putative [Entamoeba histolytica HM-1:IMSS-A]GAT94311.1 hypothetical protein CL6EHI_174650 [Entamoeba histolytica]EAL47961.1 hypothetical protein EHI_174650 [Entamoeba histolytica HM-1:IMSS]|eukprot:XP_653348.1 hypothetical protein EHI_174650 [Entamoeba histolytica HM-1:IMSS]